MNAFDILSGISSGKRPLGTPRRSRPGGLGVTCLPLDPRFAGSNPTEVDGFFQDVKILSTRPLGGTLKLGVPSLKFQAR